MGEQLLVVPEKVAEAVPLQPAAAYALKDQVEPLHANSAYSPLYEIHWLAAAEVVPCGVMHVVSVEA